MPQLDLFAAVPKPEPVENQPGKDGVDMSEKPVSDDREDQIDEITGVEESAPDVIIIAEEPKRELRANDVIFSDRNIGVKIKQKKVQEAIAEIIPEKPVRLLQKRGRKPLKDSERDLEIIEVPDDEELFKKQYYPISVVAQWFKVNTSLLRFWENEFDILKPRKNRKGDRLFRPEDVKNLQLIHHLLRQRKYSIEGAKEFLKGNKENADIQMKLTTSLLKFKSFLLELKANLQ